MRKIWKIDRVPVLVFLLFLGGCSTRPFLDFLDWARPGRVTLAPDAKPYGGVCIPQGQLPGQSSPGVAPIPSAGVVPPPAPLPSDEPSPSIPPPPPDAPPPPQFPN